MTEDEKWKIKLRVFGRNYDHIAEDDPEYYKQLLRKFLEENLEGYVSDY